MSAALKVILRAVLNAHPHLDMEGLVPAKSGRRAIDPDHDGTVLAFEKSLEWLGKVKRTSTPRPSYTSYAFKHSVEGMTRTAGTDRVYVANGVFLAAAYAAGFLVESESPGSQNAHLNISKRSLKKLDPGRFR